MYHTSDLTDLFAQLAALMTQERDALCQLDGEIGDADHGIAMQQGMATASLAVAGLTDPSFQDQFNAAAKGFLNAVGASSGPLYATAFMFAAKAIGPRRQMPLAEARQIIAAMAQGIAHRGKAEVGQKTMIDAWAPAAVAAAAQGSPAEIRAAAQAGAAATADMIATLGRAARLGARALGHRDPGAVSAALIITAVCDQIDALTQQETRA